MLNLQSSKILHVSSDSYSIIIHLVDPTRRRDGTDNTYPSQVSGKSLMIKEGGAV